MSLIDCDQSVTTQETQQGKTLQLNLLGPFNFHMHRLFREAYEQPHAEYSSYIVNLKSCPAIDSSGLGMLLLLKEYAELPRREDIRVINCRPQVSAVLKLAHFHKLFVVE